MNNWNKLSLKEKADVMKVAIGNGIYNLSDIRQAYNEYAEGGPEETSKEKTQWFNNWYSGRSQQLADNYRSYGINGQSSIGDAFMYLLPNRYTNDYFAKRAKESILNSIDTVNEGYLPSTKGQGTLTDAQYKLAQKTLNQSVSDINSDNSDEIYLLNVLQKGTYYPKEHTILYSPYADESDKIHERTHAAKAQFIKNAIRNNKPKLQNGVTSDRYLDNPSEIYSRLNSFRFENKLNPTDTVDRKKLEDFKKSAKDYDLLDRYDDDSLLFLLNDVAHNVNSQSQDGYNVTALGGPLMQLANRYEEGGPTEEDRVLDLSDRGYKSKEDLKITGTPPLVGIGPRVAKIAEKAADLNNEALYTLYNTTENLGKWIVGKMPSKYKMAVGELYNALKQNAVGTRPKEGSDFGARLPAFMQRIVDSVNDEKAYGGPLVTSANEYSKGGKIHIKPSHRGKFTRLKERTGHSASWFKLHGTPAQKKMATFELNARKWKHDEGGPLVLSANRYYK